MEHGIKPEWYSEFMNFIPFYCRITLHFGKMKKRDNTQLSILPFKVFIGLSRLNHLSLRENQLEFIRWMKFIPNFVLIISFPDQGRGVGAPPEPRQPGPRHQHPLQPRDERLHWQHEAGDTSPGPQQGDYQSVPLLFCFLFSWASIWEENLFAILDIFNDAENSNPPFNLLPRGQLDKQPSLEICSPRKLNILIIMVQSLWPPR